MRGKSMRHDFGHGEVAAYKWVNADGRSGGIVAESATVADSASIGDEATIGEDGIIGDGASIGEGASIGPDAIIGDEATIGYRASIGDRATIGAYACIGYRVSIGDEATIGDGAIIGYRASIGYRVVLGDGASIGDGAAIAADDWYISGGPCGSRGATWTAVHSREHGLRWWIGCQCGISTDALLERVQAEHGDNDHARAYRHAVRYVTTHPEYLRRVAAQAEQENGK